MNTLCEGALSLLEQVYSRSSGLFPFTSRIDGRGYRSVYEHPRAFLSTINCLLGLHEAARHRPGHPFSDRASDMTRTFLRLHEHEVTGPADLGLLMVLLAEGHDDPDALDRTVARVRTFAEHAARLRRLNAQEVSWLLWGAVAAARRGLTGAEPVAHRLFQTVMSDFVRRGEVLPRHTLNPARGGVVSFGASVYYLRSTYFYGRQYASEPAREMFGRGLTALLSAQGPEGEWPWLISSATARPLDFYPVFSVHQHSMSMLFLFPAREEGCAGIQEAIDHSVQWIRGRNQFGKSMVRHDPFFIYRSLERKARTARLERFLRARRMLVSRRGAGLAANERLVLNSECRSYELGWLLYAWAHADEIAGVH